MLHPPTHPPTHLLLISSTSTKARMSIRWKRSTTSWQASANSLVVSNRFSTVPAGGKEGVDFEKGQRLMGGREQHYAAISDPPHPPPTHPPTHP